MKNNDLLECPKCKLAHYVDESGKCHRCGTLRIARKKEKTDTPETDSWTSDGIGGLKVVPASACRKLERERNAMKDWIMQAAPLLSAASCVVIDIAPERLDEIAGRGAVLESCPVDFTKERHEKD